jgi:DNA-binding transcriptional ArsR family regulator
MCVLRTHIEVAGRVSTNNVQNTHILRAMPQLHRSLIDIASALNRPENDAAMLEKAGLSLERALFPLLVLVERLGPIGVVDLAGRVGRDHTTVSRQVARLEELGLVQRRAGQADRGDHPPGQDGHRRGRRGARADGAGAVQRLEPVGLRRAGAADAQVRRRHERGDGGGDLVVVSKKVVHTLPGCEAFDAGVGSGEVIGVGPGLDGLGAIV